MGDITGVVMNPHISERVIGCPAAAGTCVDMESKNGGLRGRETENFCRYQGSAVYGIEPDGTVKAGIRVAPFELSPGARTPGKKGRETAKTFLSVQVETSLKTLLYSMQQGGGLRKTKKKLCFIKHSFFFDTNSFFAVLYFFHTFGADILTFKINNICRIITENAGGLILL